MSRPQLTDAKRRLLERLKCHGPATAGALANGLGLTDVAVRQHLCSLEQCGWVQQSRLPSEGRGRPSCAWSLTDAARCLFPDRHAELTVGFIVAARRALGEEAMQRIVRERAKDQVAQYAAQMPAAADGLAARVKALAEQRTAEGYMAEVVQDGPGSFTLVEHHCSICEAARACTGLCAAELDVFREVLGDGTQVERVAHLISGDDRCAYRITSTAHETVRS